MKKLNLIIAAASLVFTGAVHAQTFTGDPATDSWTSEGSSSSAADYIDGAGNYSANLYSTAFTLSASSSLLNLTTGSNWSTGDTVVGVGGVFSGANSDLTYSGGADQNGISHTGATSTRIVIKYGTSAATWSAPTSSTTAPGYGSLANGGIGSVLLGTYAYDFYPTNSGTLITPADAPQEQTSASGTTAINGDVGQVVTFWSGNTLVGFESFLDLTLLNSQDPSNQVALGDDFDLDLQRGSGNFQDSLGTLPGTLAVPEPSAALLGLIALGTLFHLRRRTARLS